MTAAVVSLALIAKAVLSAAAVGLLLALLRRAGPRACGLAAAVPVNSMPALFWLSVDRGGAYAAATALGSLLGTALTVLVGLSTIGAARLALRRRRANLPRPAARRTGVALAMAVAGAMSLVVSALARHGGPQVCGIVAALPVLGACATVAGYRDGGLPVMLAVLGGYLDGMLAKAVFLAGLGVAWAAGAGLGAWPIATTAAMLALLTQRSLRQWRTQAGRSDAVRGSTPVARQGTAAPSRGHAARACRMRAIPFWRHRHDPRRQPGPAA